MVLINSKQAAHAAASSVAALQAKNPMDPADSQVKSAVAPNEGVGRGDGGGLRDNP